MSDVLDELFLRHAGKALEQQMVLKDAIGEARWTLDLQDGLLRFGDRGLSIQLLGAVSQVEHTWTWAWGHRGLSGHTLIAARRLEELGREHDIPELAQTTLSLDDVDPGKLAVVCAALVNAQGHFVAPYPEEAVYMLIIDPLFPIDVELTAPLAALIISRIGTAFPNLDHPAAVRAYLKGHGLTVEDDGSTLSATCSDGSTVRAEYDGPHVVSAWSE